MCANRENDGGVSPLLSNSVLVTPLCLAPPNNIEGKIVFSWCSHGNLDKKAFKKKFTVNAFITGNLLFGTKLLGICIARGFGAFKGLRHEDGAKTTRNNKPSFFRPRKLYTPKRRTLRRNLHIERKSMAESEAVFRLLEKKTLHHAVRAGFPHSSNLSVLSAAVCSLLPLLYA